MSAIFIDVDVQRDFCAADGALFVQGSPNEAFRGLTQWALEQRIPIIGSVDSHAYDAWEFASNDNVGPDGQNPGFPDHCIKGTPGWLKVDGTLAERFRFVPNVNGVDVAALVGEVKSSRTQALYFEKEVYSMFANPLAEPFLQELCRQLDEPPRFYVYGVATDYCVKAATLGLRERDYETVLIRDAIAGITPDGVEAAMTEMRDAGVTFQTVADVTAPPS